MDLPEKPDESDCCNSGCNPCIFDVYESYLKKWKNKVQGTTECENCISPLYYSIFKLIKVIRESEEAFLYTFEYIRPLKGERSLDISLIYKPGQHFLLKGTLNNEDFTRAYTPIPIVDNTKLHFTALIKLYKHGKMSNYLKSLEVGSDTLWRGPYGTYNVNYNSKHMFLLAQGTGIAPIYSTICDIINNEDCYTFIKLFFCCRDCNNIYLRENLYKLSSNWNFNYEIFLSNSDNIYAKYNEVIHNKKLTLCNIKGYLLDKHEDVHILICGSEHFIEVMKQYLTICKIKNQNVYSF